MRSSTEGTGKASPEPVKPARLTIRFLESGDRLAFTCRRRQWGAGCFLILWLIGWTVGCVVLAGMVLREPAIRNFLFAIPFWASWLFVLALVLNMFFRVDYFALDTRGVDFVSRVLVPLRRRYVPLEEIARFTHCSKVVDSESNRTEEGIEMQTLGQSLSFAWGLPGEEREWLQYQLNKCLAVLRRIPMEQVLTEEGRLPDEPTSRETETALGEVAPHRVLAGSRVVPQPPSDCRWQQMDQFGDIVFTQRGRFSLGACFGLLFINAFWNGIVAVFVVGLWSGEFEGKPGGAGWWLLFVFLIPFQVIGLAMFLALVGAVLEPLRRTSWRFGRKTAECSVKWLGLGPVWRYRLDSLARIELATEARDEKKSQGNYHFFGSPAGANKRLRFIDKANTEICAMPRLTEGETLWIRGILQLEHAAWLR